MWNATSATDIMFRLFELSSYGISLKNKVLFMEVHTSEPSMLNRDYVFTLSHNHGPSLAVQQHGIKFGCAPIFWKASYMRKNQVHFSFTFFLNSSINSCNYLLLLSVMNFRLF